MTLLCQLFGCAETTASSMEYLMSPDALSSEDINERYLASILSTMQGETAQALKLYASEHEIRITTSPDLPFRIGEYNPTTRTVTLEIPVGLEENFDELVIAGRRVMYEELDHAMRMDSRIEAFLTDNGMSGEDLIDGQLTSLEAMARVAAYRGMSEDAQIGSAPSLQQQFGVPETGEAIYYSVFNPGLADTFFSGIESLPEGEQPHENMGLMEDIFSGFYGTATSEWYTLEYASQLLSEDFLADYDQRKPLADVLNDFISGRNYEQGDLDAMTTLIGQDNPLGTILADELEDGSLTGEAENLTVRDLLRHMQRHVGTDGPHNPLERTRSAGDIFREGSPEQLIELLETQAINMERLGGFFRRCSQADYIPESAREVLGGLSSNIANDILPFTQQTVSGTVAMIRSTDELTLSDRLAVKQIHNAIHEILYPLSETRVDVHEDFVRGQERQCTYINSWGSP
ncbi:MAG: hypothetical protein AB8B83_08960 [Bdellovibrionales bacterium]